MASVCMIDWSQLCISQASRPLWQLQLANYGSNIFAVNSLRLLLIMR